MRKIIVLMLAAVLALSLAACAQPGPSPSTEPSVSNAAPSVSAEAPPAQKTYKIGFATLSTEGDFMSLVASQLKERFEKKGHKFEIASADFNPAKQIEQIENFITLKVDVIITMPVDPAGLSDVAKKAMDAGIKFVAFSTATTQYDLFLGTDNYASGKAEAVMAGKWIDKTFPDAADGSIEVAILENRDKPEFAQRSDGFKEVTNVCKKAKVVTTVGVDTTPKGGQAAAENVIVANPNVKVFICFNADTAMGVDAFATALNSPIKDKSKFAAFSIDFNTPAVEAFKKSLENKSIWRGTIMMFKSLDDMFQTVVDKSLSTLDGTLKEKDSMAPLYEVTPENVDAAAAGTL